MRNLFFYFLKCVGKTTIFGIWLYVIFLGIKEIRVTLRHFELFTDIINKKIIEHFKLNIQPQITIYLVSLNVTRISFIPRKITYNYFFTKYCSFLYTLPKLKKNSHRCPS